MVVKNVIDILNKENKTSMSAEYYYRIDKWRRWWAGFDSTFHRYREIAADGTIKKRDLYTLKMAKKICEDWASVLLNEKTKITTSSGSANRFLMGESGYGGIFEKVSFWNGANALVEKAFYSGTGAMVLKIKDIGVENDNIADVSKATLHIDFLPAQNIIPLRVEHGHIVDALFLSTSMESGTTYVYTEEHRKTDTGYTITNKRYKVKKGGQLERSALPNGVASRIDLQAPPFFAIIKPNIQNPHEDNMGLGCSVFDSAMDCLKGVDLAFNNFCRDFWLGGKKVFYNRELTKTIGVDASGEPIYIAPDDMQQQLFVAIGDEMEGDGKSLIHEFNPSLRVEDNVNGIQGMLDYLSFKCGLGTRYYEFDNQTSAITATQYTGEKQELKQNAAHHGILIEAALQQVVRAMLWAGKNILNQDVDDETDIIVNFSDGYIISDEEKRAADRQDLIDGVMKKWEYRVKWYGDTEAEAKALFPDVSIETFGLTKYPGGEDGA